MSLDEIINFAQLSATLWTSGQPNESEFQALAVDGVQVVINLALPTSDNALPNEPEIVRSLGMEHIHIPVVWEDPTPANLVEFMDKMDALGEKKKVLVHCALNYRASCFVALWRVLRLNWAQAKAFESVYKIWNPAEYPIWENFIAKNLKQ